MAVDFARCDFVWLLAGLGALSGGGSRLRLAGGGRAGGLGASLQRICGALEQECEFRERIRPIVLELISPHKTICCERRRVFDAEFYPDTRNDDPWIGWRAVATGCRAENTVSPITAGGSCGAGGRIAAACGRNLPSGKENLDTKLGFVQRRNLLPNIGRICVDH